MLRVKYTPPPDLEPLPRSRVKPLTHHEILTLVGPFTAHDLHPDLAASDRAERLLAFKPIDYQGSDPAQTRLQARLYLENPEDGRFRLIRMLHHPSGATASLHIDGSDPGAMVEQILAVDPGRQFQTDAGILVARSYRINNKASARAGPELTRAEAELGDIRLMLNARTGRGLPMEIELSADDSNLPHIPQDLLAVLGWDWRALRRIGRRWRGTLRVSRDEPARTADAEAKLTRVVNHLAHTLAEPPSRYHPRFRRQRRSVALRRVLPLAVGLGVLAATPLIQLLELSDGSIMRLIIFHAPPLLMVGMFMVKEMPRFEVPPLPRPLHDDAWVPLGDVALPPNEEPVGKAPSRAPRPVGLVLRGINAIGRSTLAIGRRLGRGLRTMLRRGAPSRRVAK